MELYSFNLIIENLLVDRHEKEINKRLTSMLYSFNLIIENLLVDRQQNRPPTQQQTARFNLIIENLLVDSRRLHLDRTINRQVSIS